jgi:hypothetical protein
MPLCSVNPVATPPCRQILGLARQALTAHARLLAYQRPAPIVARGDQTVWPAAWAHNSEERALAPTAPGQAIARIAVANGQRYELWVAGSFDRGFDVSVDGVHVARIKDQLSIFQSFFHIADVYLGPEVHTVTLTYPHADLTPGSGDHGLTSLSAIALVPKSPPSELIGASPSQAAALCGRPLDWIELVTGS